MTMEQATMQEHIKTFKKRLRGMGFQKKSDRVFWYDNNGLFYVVSFKMAGKVTAKIGFEVSHAGMFADGVPEPRHCPVGGWLGRWGLCDGFSVHGDNDGSLQWLEAVLDADFLERAACDFFSYFKSAADWQKATTKWQDGNGWWTDDWPAVIDGAHFLDKPIPDNVGGQAVDWFVNQTPDEMRSADEFARHMQSLLAANAQRLGFTLRDKQLLVRRRGKLYDCIALALDEFGCFCSIKPFIWSDTLSERFLVFDECPYNNYNVELLPGAVWIRSTKLMDNAGYLAELIAKATAFFPAFKTTEDWVEYLDQHVQSESIKHTIATLKAALSQEHER